MRTPRIAHQIARAQNCVPFKPSNPRALASWQHCVTPGISQLQPPQNDWHWQQLQSCQGPVGGGGGLGAKQLEPCWTLSGLPHAIKVPQIPIVEKIASLCGPISSHYKVVGENHKTKTPHVDVHKRVSQAHMCHGLPLHETQRQ